MNKNIVNKYVLYISVFIFLLSFIRSYATAPPRPGEIEKYEKDGSLAQRLEFGKRLQNYRAHPDLVARKKTKLQAEKDGKAIDVKSLPYQTGLPAFGAPRIFVLPIEFPDYPHTQDISVFQNSLFGSGDPNNYPYDSLTNYYYRSSYGNLAIQGDVMPWYMAPLNRDNYPSDVKPLIKGALNALVDSVDFTQYDNNGDGIIDYFICYWTGPDTGWNSTYWAWCDMYGMDFGSDPYTVDGKKLRIFSWVWEKNDGQGEPNFDPLVSIHETGHGIGLPDYYDYKKGSGLEGGLGNMDMMDNGWFDHNAFSKWLLDWLSPTVVGDSNVIHNITLRNSDSFGDAVAIMPWQNGNIFDEYFIVQNRIRYNNDATAPGSTPLYNEGLVIFHVDAKLNTAGDDFEYDNSYSSHKLLRLMEADGQERIEKYDHWADATDFYLEGASFSHVSTPSSDSYYYSPNRNGVYVTNISPGWSTRSASFVNASNYIFPDLSTALDNNTLIFTTGGNSIWYGIQKSDATNLNAAQSPALTDNQSSTLQTTVSGQGTLDFSWKVSSEPGGDTLQFFIDGAYMDSISGEVDWQWKTFRVTKTGTGVHTFLWKYNKNGSGAAGQDRGWLDNVQFAPLTPSLGEALDNPVLIWAADGDNGWYGQTASSIYGGSSAKSDVIGDNQKAWLKTQVDGSGTLNFYWKTSSELNADWLKFDIDGITMDQISGGTQWALKSFFLKTKGIHSLTWKYIKNGSGAAYSDCAYVDRVEFIPTGSLAEAVDNNMLEFSSGGGSTYSWVYQTYYNFYGGDAAQSGYTPNNGETFLSTTVDAPGLLTFFWKVSSEQNHDYLEFCINDVWQQRISGEKEWAMMYDIYISGPCMLKWRYKKDAANTSGNDAAWVDRISYNYYNSNLSDAVDNHALPLKTYGDRSWSVDNSIHYYGSSSIKAGPMADKGMKSIPRANVQSCLSGPGTISFYWRASTEDVDWAPLKFMVDNVELGRIGGIADWEQRSFTLSPGTHTVLWYYESFGDTTNGNEDTVWLDKVEYIKEISLNEAIDNSSLVLESYGGGTSWTGVEDVTAYTGDAARSGPIPDGYGSFLDTTVNGPKSLSFNWRVSSEENKDALEFYIDDVFQTKISGNKSWEQKNYLLGAGPHSLRWEYYKDGSGSAGSDCAWIDKVKLTSTPSIAEALDFTGFVWNTDGNAAWVGQTFTAYYDDDAAQSGKISGNQYTRLYTNITGPGLFYFWWKVSSEDYFDPFEFYIDGEKRNTISGEVDWQQKTYIIEPGDHLIEWKYSKNSAFNDGADCGWVDRIQWTPGIVPSCDLNVPYQYPTIQEAINAAREGCTVTVFPGRYYENIFISGKNIVVTSMIPSDQELVKETIIDGGQKGPVVAFGGDEYYSCKLAGFTITNGLAENGGGIEGNGTLATIEDNIISSNTATVCGGGIWYNMGTIQRNIISHNRADYSGGGIFRCHGTVQNNFIYGNFAGSYGGGIGWCNGAVQNNTIYGNEAGLEGGGSFAANTQLKNCIFWNNTAPEAPEIHVDHSFPPDPPLTCCIKDWTGLGTDIVTANPRFFNPDRGNFHILFDSPCVDEGTTIAELTEDIDRDTRPILMYTRPRGHSHYDIGADECKNTGPEINVISPEGDMETFSKSYNIMWYVSDVDCEGSTSLSLVPNQSEIVGTLIVSGIKSIKSNMDYIFENEGAPEGIHYVYGKISDGFHSPSSSYSPGTIKISRVTREELINHLLKRKDLPLTRLPFADFNNDGIVDVADLISLLKI
jgi:M6 family metalloprotease-like protein